MKTWKLPSAGLLVTALLMAGCECGAPADPAQGDGGADASASMDDGGARDGAAPARCGNGTIEGSEACDDGNRAADDGCAADCTLECGDGTVSGSEICDTGIAGGEAGACPTSCDDGDPCTTDALTGSECSVECSHGDITIPSEGDACCPPGADASNDGDCTAVCGNGTLEPGELCDTTIAAGEAGACPTSCDDGDDCTTDALSMGGTCAAACTATPITSAVDGDMCCPPGASLATDADCAIACGDGVVSTGEACDTAIAAGAAGACPSACDDGVACTADMLVNGGTCSATCASAAITAPMDGDGCCPPGATIGTDSDCTATCGDTIVSGGESCDTAIAAGMAGACPTSCSDGMACTTDTLTGAGTCAATCSYPAITAPMDGDGCCPPGATIATDGDCAAACGDGVVSASAGETCDTAITRGTGMCPTTCEDRDACTADALANAGTCRARCTTTPIGAGPMDMCCPAGATLATDPDCAPSCGDTVITPPEACDDGNTMSGDGCSDTCLAEPIAFRFTDMDLRDPHVFASIIFGCNDVTDSFFGMGINPLIQDNIQNDGDSPADGNLDLSIVHVFAPLVQSAGDTTPSYLAFPDCTAPMSSTMCTLAAGSMRTMGTAMNMGAGATCLGTLPGTARGYTPAVGVASAPAGGTCYVASAGVVSFNLGGIPITLYDAYVGGAWSGVPATGITNGLIRGFLTEADADATIIPDGTTGIASIDGQPLSSLLRGGTGACRDPAPNAGDKDTYTDPSTGMTLSGWYFYLNFSAVEVPYTEL